MIFLWVHNIPPPKKPPNASWVCLEKGIVWFCLPNDLVYSTQILRIDRKQNKPKKYLI